jgi:hypothetical protein
MNWYIYCCPHCGKIVKRLGDWYTEKSNGCPKKWIKSWCEEKGVDARLQLMEE